MLLLEYPKCTTCKRARAWLDERGLVYEARNIKDDRPSAEELAEWHKLSGLPLKRFFNTSGLVYKSLKLKDRLPRLSEAEQLELLATDGMLVKRPLLITGSAALAGFSPNEWERLLREGGLL